MKRGSDASAKRNETPAERAAAVKESFEQKVAIFERWARDGVPEGIMVPENRSQLRRWRGPDGDLRAWSDPMIDKEWVGRYPDLTRRFLDALGTIQKRRGAKGDRLKQLEAELAVVTSEKGNLESQNATLIGEKDYLERRTRVLTDILEANGIKAPS